MTTPIQSAVLIGQSPAMRGLRALIEQVAPTRLPVLIEGETGTGKELVAGLLHQLSRRNGNFVPFNVCAIGDSMFEDALFGHVRGSYTGAVSDSLGYLREADRGTAFFDEISALPMGLQAKLLRAIETGVFRPIGATRDARSDFRVVAATNESLVDAGTRGAFRADLRHRLSGVVVRVPPLSERVEDIPDLARFFLREAAELEVRETLDSGAIRLLMELSWPGNVRELKLVVETATALAPGSVDRRSVERALLHRPGMVCDSLPVNDESLRRRELIVALHDAKWDVDRTADGLGLHRTTLYRRMKEHGIEPPRFAARSC
ncbi:MAG: sigma-54 dependent transcriptional regulator [Gemmatimonadaceae bacterium]